MAGLFQDGRAAARAEPRCVQDGRRACGIRIHARPCPTQLIVGVSVALAVNPVTRRATTILFWIAGIDPGRTRP